MNIQFTFVSVVVFLFVIFRGIMDSQEEDSKKNVSVFRPALFVVSISVIFALLGVADKIVTGAMQFDEYSLIFWLLGALDLFLLSLFGLFSVLCLFVDYEDLPFR